MEKKEFLADLCTAQLKIKAPKKDKVNPRFKTNYCSLDSIYDAIRIPLAEHGFVVKHNVVKEGEQLWLETTLLHKSGESIQNSLPMFVEQMTNQGFASAQTYAKRYGICSLLGLPGDEDDDAEIAEKEQKKPDMSEQIRRDQVAAIHTMLKNHPQRDFFLQAILEEYGLESLEKGESPILGKIIMKLQRG